MYFWRQHTVKITGPIQKSVICCNCSHKYEYLAVRDGYGGGHSPFIVFNNKGAVAAAEKWAQLELQTALNNSIDAVPCPRCFVFQPDMIGALQTRNGKQFNPNKYVNDRRNESMLTAWTNARSENSKSAYKKFIETWPVIEAQIRDYDFIHPTVAVLNHHARSAIRELRYPTWMRAALKYSAWLLWGSIVAIFLVTAAYTFS